MPYQQETAEVGGWCQDQPVPMISTGILLPLMAGKYQHNIRQLYLGESNPVSHVWLAFIYITERTRIAF